MVSTGFLLVQRGWGRPDNLCPCCCIPASHTVLRLSSEPRHRWICVLVTCSIHSSQPIWGEFGLSWPVVSDGLAGLCHITHISLLRRVSENFFSSSWKLRPGCWSIWDRALQLFKGTSTAKLKASLDPEWGQIILGAGGAERHGPLTPCWFSTEGLVELWLRLEGLNEQPALLTGQSALMD